MPTAAPAATLQNRLTGEARSSTKRTFRRDIQGLRTIAVLAVLIYHLAPTALPGGFVGVDIFFVISGFLITGLLLREIESTGTISLRSFYARRAKRLFPAAALVLAATVGLTLLFLPEPRWGSIGWDVIASAFFVENWRLAAVSVDYLSQDAAPSPLQHFWSLGVEEQFYFVWPFLLIAIGFFFTRGRHRGSGISSRRFRPTVICVLSTVTAVSFALSIVMTAASPDSAYFVTPTRVWELALGALLAASIGYTEKLSDSLLAFLGWAGIAGIAASLMLIGATVPYPGSAALLPAAATALVIAGGARPSRFGPAGVLGVRPALFVGNISYSLYLWHWPVIVVATAMVERISVSLALLLAALSMILAWGCYRFVEKPIMKSEILEAEPVRAMQVGLTMTMVAALLGMWVVYQDGVNKDQARAAAAATAPASGLDTGDDTDGRPEEIIQGALTLPEPPAGVEPADSFPRIAPAPVNAAADWHNCPSTEVAGTEVQSCSFGPSDGIQVALVGDSHAKQWIPALEPIAIEHGWRVDVYLHDACPFAAGELRRGDDSVYETCMLWNAEVQERLLARSELAAVIATNYTHSAGPATGGISGMAQLHSAAWQQFIEIGVPVIAIRDTPSLKYDVPECVAEHGGELSKCARPRSEVFDDRGLALVEAASITPGASLIDLNEYICPGTSCAAVIGEVLVYRDSDHLTMTYARSLSRALGSRLVPLIEGSEPAPADEAAES
ncbi:acyltransferase family protein [Leucobacter tenebrionis]|uniref:acyltransferase family protein n=1 Tax=Leucobacter tenebrionis TaxID=2873270 RepID=UPI001CA6AA29|nr:acyltransferase family protein [Leucobacter tenebrionis]QZY52155.1 acyltransferase [Leucobacter tenebrionis]